MRHATLLLGFSAGILLSVGRAEAVEVSAKVDRTRLAVGETLSLNVVILGGNGEVSEPVLPPLDDWVFYPSGRSQQISIVNGQFSGRLAFTYLLIPRTPGKKVIGPITVRYDGRPYRTNQIDVEVTPGETPPSMPTRPPAYTPPAPQPPSRRGGIFLQAYVDTLQTHVDEPVTLTVAFYQAFELPQPPEYTPPTLEGFEEDEPARTQRIFEQLIDGVPYRVKELRTILRPTAPGKHTIGPARLLLPGLSIQSEEPRRPYSLFDHFNMEQPMVLTTDPITIDVLPAGNPASRGRI